MTFMMNPNIDQKTVGAFIKYIETLLTKDEDMVQFESAKTICELYELYGDSVNVETAFQVLV